MTTHRLVTALAAATLHGAGIGATGLSAVLSPVASES